MTVDLTIEQVRCIREVMAWELRAIRQAHVGPNDRPDPLVEERIWLLSGIHQAMGDAR